LDVVDRIDTTVLHARHPNDGAGRAAYDPDMLLALLIYAYCGGVRSSRQIERLCEVDVGYRVICANLVPDHTTIARFRQGHQAHAQDLFVEVLMLCAEAGLATVGVVAVDGTRIAADASRKKNRRREWIEGEVARMFGEADDVDRDQDDSFGDGRGDEPPPVLRGREARRGRLDAALARLNRERRERAERAETARRAAADAAREAAARGHGVPGRAPKGTEVERAHAKLARLRERAVKHRCDVEAAAAAKGRKPAGPAPGPGLRVAGAEARLRAAQAKADAAQQAPAGPDSGGQERVNVTDPDSNLMKSPGGWIQGYNAQAAVNTHGVVLAAEVTQDHNDAGQCVPMMAATRANLDLVGHDEPVGVMLFDAGYLSEANLTADGPDRLIATGKAWTLKRSDPTSGPPPEGAGVIDAMEHRLRTPEGAALYALRQHTVEPVFGTIKEQRGYRRFTRRGLTAVQAEWQLITAAHNLRKLFDHRLA
jgi:transposase